MTIFFDFHPCAYFLICYSSGSILQFVFKFYRKRQESRNWAILAHFYGDFRKLEVISHRKIFFGGANAMKAPWRCQVEKTLHWNVSKWVGLF